MTGLSWSGCGTVLVVESSANGTDSSIVVSDCTFSGNRNDPAAAASCIDATQGFAGNLTISSSTFSDNGLVRFDPLAANVPPVAIICSGGTSATSCNITVSDTTFDSNGAQEALGMGLMCNSSSPIQACVFELTRTNFTNNLLLGPGLNHTVNTNSVNANYGFVNTTAAALVVKADGNSAYSLTVTACSFAHNQGGGLLVQQLWPDFSPLPVSGHVFVINSSFTEHLLLPGGLPALAVFGALDVTLSGSVLRNNSMGAAALELIQDAVIIDTLVMADNIAINATASSMDIFMVDNGSPSSVDISGSLFANNTGFSYNTSLLHTALKVDIKGVLAADNLGGAVFVQGVSTVSVSHSQFDRNHGFTGMAGSGWITAATYGGASITAEACNSLSVHQSSFEGNTVLTSGAAIFAYQIYTVSVHRCTFSSNRAWTAYGGAIYVSETYAPANISVTDSSFDSCVAGSAGGVIHIDSPNGAGPQTLYINRCNFTNSAAGVLSGPAGWVTDQFGYARNKATYLANSEYHGGGAVWAVQTSLHIQGSRFENCSAPHAQGGAVKARFSGAGQIIDSVFLGNTALSGGAVSLSNMNMAYGEEFEMSNSTFVANSAVMVPQRNCPTNSCVPNEIVLVPGSGGAIQISGTALLLSRGCSFISNTAEGRGGALFAELPFDTSIIRITSQQGARIGSAVAALTTAPEGLPLTYSIIFLNNTAQVSGGAIAARNYPLSISAAAVVTSTMNSTRDTALTYSLFQGNSAPTGGAVSVFQAPEVSLSHILFHTNIAVESSTEQRVTDEGGAGHGGAVSIVGSSGDVINITSSSLYNNVARFGGGLAVHASPSECTTAQQLDGCFGVSLDATTGFFGNRALDGAGGAIFWSHPGNINISCGSLGRVQFDILAATASLPSSNLPCTSWENNSVTAAGYGPVVASTPFYLDPLETQMPFYTSNQPLLLNVTVKATGVVLTDVVNGLASFTGVRVRGAVGSNFTMSFSALTRYRALTPLETLNEYLDPGARDLCVNCTAGTFNLVPTNTLCAACPAGATCSSACLGNATCQLSGLEFAGFIVPSGGMWHSSMFSDQVMACPNPKSCTYPSRQQKLQLLQVTVRNAYHGQQYLQVVGQQPQSNAYRRLQEATEPAAFSRPTPLSRMSDWLLHNARSLLGSPSATPSSPNNPPSGGTAPPPSQQSSPSPSDSHTDAALLDAFYAATTANMTEYSSTLCAVGYKGRLCGVCATRFGSTDVATCRRCPTFAANTVYYILATMLTLTLLALSLHSALQQAEQMMAENDVDMEEEDEEEEVDVEEDEVLGDAAVDHDHKHPQQQQQHLPAGPVAYTMMTSRTHRSKAHQHADDSPTALVNSPTAEGHSHRARGDSPRMKGSNAKTSHFRDGTFTRPSAHASPGSPRLSEQLAFPMAAARAPDTLENLGQQSSLASKVTQGSHHSKVNLPTIATGNTMVRHLASDTNYVAEGRLALDTHLNTLIRSGSPRELNPRQTSRFASQRGLSKPGPSAHSMARADSKYSRDLYEEHPVRSHFYDKQDPIVQNAQRALQVILRIFLSYLQVCLSGRGGGGARGVDETLPVLQGVSSYMARVTTMTTLTVVFFFYPTAIQSIMEIFDCDSVDTNTATNPLMARSGLSLGTYWRQDYSQQCYQGSHMALAMGLGVPGLVLLALGWPVGCGFWLYVNADKLYTDLPFTGMYGWWESVVSIRKLAVALLVVFLHVLTAQGLQLLIVSMVLGMALYLQVVHMPYNNGYYNWLEFLALAASTTTIYFSLFFSNTLRDTPLAIVTTAVILMNTLTICVFVLALIRAGWHTMLQLLNLCPKDQD
ncbi:MAG: hypothetical protein WDW38_011274 [Sanguina aurantia]